MLYHTGAEVPVVWERRKILNPFPHADVQQICSRRLLKHREQIKENFYKRKNNYIYYLYLYNNLKQEGHDGPGSLTLIIQCTAMQNTSRQLF